MIGKIISHYKILEKVGEGGMGEVYLAQDTKLNRRVALKFLPVQLASDGELKERFKREAQAAAALNHPNIITIHEVAEYETRPFIAMEYVEGESLKDLISKKDLSINEVLDISLQISDGLAVAHRAGIIHRDIKPQNILMGKDGRVRICDFGLAKAKRDITLTQAGSTLGTIGYMSPEQAQGKGTDHRSDIFSLGVVLYEMITSQLPFKGEHDAATIHSIVNDTPEPLARYKSDVPEELQRIVGKAVEKDREVRYQHSDDLRADLGRLKTELETGVGKALETAAEPAPSIAVLPFANLSADKEQEYFCDGMAENIINALTQVEDLRVVARTSAFVFKEKREDIREIGRKLSVRMLLEGSLQKAGNRLRITAQLINVADGYHLWSEKYDRDMEDVFAIQDEISLAIVDKLKLKLLGGAKAKLMKRHTEDLDAYSLYLKGRYFFNKRTEEGLKRSIEYFERAIENDPGYALAYAGLADSYSTLPDYSSVPPKEANPKAKEAAMRALEIDNKLSEAYAALGTIRWGDWDWEGAEREFLRAIELSPGCETAHWMYAYHLMYMARFDEAIREMKQALELDPLSLAINRNLGQVFYHAGQYDQAIEQLQKTIEMDPHFSYAHLLLGLAYGQKSMYKEALAELEKEKALSGGWDPFAGAWFAPVHVVMGMKGRVQKALDDFTKRSEQAYVPPCGLALLHFALGENDQGFEWLHKAYEASDSWLRVLKIFPGFASVRSDPRFKALLKKVGLEK